MFLWPYSTNSVFIFLENQLDVHRSVIFITTGVLSNYHSKKQSYFKNLFYCRYLVPIWNNLCKIFFLPSIGTSDRYVQQIDRAMKTYNFCNFNILGIVQFKFNSLIVLLHILSQSTCLNRLISIEYKNKWNILITSNLSCTSDRCTFWPILQSQLSKLVLIFFPKSFKGHSQFRSFLFVYLIENHFLLHLEVSNLRPTDFFNFVTGSVVYSWNHQCIIEIYHCCCKISSFMANSRNHKIVTLFLGNLNSRRVIL